MRRRLIDRLFSLFVPVRRYWCYDCHWQGNLRADDALPFVADAFPWSRPAPAVADILLRPQPAAAPQSAAPEPQRRRALAVAGRGFGD